MPKGINKQYLDSQQNRDIRKCYKKTSFDNNSNTVTIPPEKAQTIGLDLKPKHSLQEHSSPLNICITFV